MSAWNPGAVILGDYLIEKELGRGGMGRVWLVTSQSTGRRFAVKQALIRDEKHRKAFLTELQTWIDLPEHPNIVPCRFFRTVSDEIVIFADYIEGGSLADWIAKEKLTGLEQILDVAIQFAWGLHAIHERGLVHQDVKPGNVLMTPDGVPMVTDFGLARARVRAPDGAFVSPALPPGPGHQSVLVSSGGMTPAYASPEQRNGKPLSRKTDIWSWGVSVLDMFMGGVSCPHGGHIAAEVLEALIESGQSDGSLPSMPEAVAQVLRGCFAATPERRLSDFGQVVDNLKGVYRRSFGREYRRRTTPASRQVTTEKPPGSMGRYYMSPELCLAAARRVAGMPDGPSAKSVFSERGGIVRDTALVSEACEILTVLASGGRSEVASQLVEATWLRADLHRRMGDTGGRIAALNETARVLETLPRNTDGMRESLASVFYWQAWALFDAGEFDAVDGLCRAAVDMAKAVHDPDAAMLLVVAGAYHVQAKALAARGVNDLADRAFSHAVKTLRDASSAFPDDQDIQRALALENHNWAALQQEVGAPDAVGLYQEAIEIREKLIASFPGDQGLQSDLAGSYSNVCALLADKGDEAAALAAVEKAVMLREQLCSTARGRDFAEGLARAYFNKGGLLFRFGRHEQAFDEFSKALCGFLQLVDLEGRTDILGSLALTEAPIHDILAQSATDDPNVADSMYARHAERLRGVAARDAQGESPRQLAALLSNWAGVKETIGRPDEAATLLSDAITALEGSMGEEPGDRWRETLALAYFNLGTALHRMGDARGACAAWKTSEDHCAQWGAVQKRPQMLECLGRASVALAYQLARSGNYREAMRRLDNVKTFIKAWRGDHSSGLQTVLSSVIDLREQIEAHRNHDQRSSTRQEAHKRAEEALALRDAGRVSEALSRYREALALDPDDADIWTNYGAACAAAEDHAGAVEAFDRALAIAPGSAVAWHNRGVILFQQGHYADALPALEKAYSLGHQSSMNALAKCRGMVKRLGRITS